MNMKGKVTRVFMAKDSGFKILVLTVDDIKTIPAQKRNPDFPDSVTLIGMMRGVEAEYVIEVSGEWENRANGAYWPWQFKVADVMICEFETPILVRKFLSGLSCVGPELAKRILKVFPNAVEVIERQPKKLTEIKDINEQRAMQIHKSFLEQKEKKSLGIFLQKYSVKSEDVNKISSHYGSNSLRIVKSNPYRLCEDRFLSFKICDRIGKDLGFAPDSESRLKCAMNYVLYTKAGAKGHVYLTEEMLVEETNGFFRENSAIDSSFSVEHLERKLHNLVANNEVVCDIVILDHHEPGDVLPEPDAMIDLHIDGETYPFTELTGSGLAWKVAHYMLEQSGEHEFAMSLVDLAAIGTIGDVAPLHGENRSIVKRAIRLMRQPLYKRYGVKALMRDLSHVTAEDIAFRLAPCLNAPGRLSEHTVNICLDEKGLFPMLKRTELFLQAMTTHGLTKYFDTVTNPVLSYAINDEN